MPSSQNSVSPKQHHRKDVKPQQAKGTWVHKPCA